MDEALIVFIVFGSMLLIVKLALDYARDKHRMRASSESSSSLTSSELRAIVHDAVEEALDDRLARLEKHLEKMPEPRLIPAGREESDLTSVKPESPPVQRDRDTML